MISGVPVDAIAAISLAILEAEKVFLILAAWVCILLGSMVLWIQKQSTVLSKPVESQLIGREYVGCDFPGCSKSRPPKRCSRCQCAYYCNTACQRSHWRTGHREYCFDVKIMRKQLLGIGEEVETAKEREPLATNACCFICLSKPIDDPCTLPRCGHSFCFGCLQHWQGHVKKQGSLDMTSSSLTCPACRADAPDIEKSVIETAILYASRANRRGLRNYKQKKYRELALTELKGIDEASMNPAIKIQTLFTKAEVLQQLGLPGEALKALEELEEIEKKGTKNATEIDGLLDRLQAAEDDGRMEDTKSLKMKIEWETETMHVNQLSHFGFDLYLKIAEVKEAMEDWEGALDVYKNKVMLVMDPSGPESFRGTPSQQRMMYMGMSRCMYYLKNYEAAIGLGHAAIQMNRHFPQAHKYVALAQKANGDIEGAIRTMGKAVNYETPWDEVNKKKVLEMYEQIRDCLN